MIDSQCQNFSEDGESNKAAPPGLILLAGGNSSRMGVPKGLLPWQGGTLIEAHCQQFHAVGGALVVVVLGIHAGVYLNKLEWLKKDGKWPGLRVIYCLNPTPENGQFSSLLEGLKCVMDFRNGCLDPNFVQPVDMPPPDREVYLHLHHSMGSSQKVGIPTFRAQSGHPVLLSTSFQRKLLALQPGDQQRLDHQIHTLPETSVQYTPVVDHKVILNFNTPSDLPVQEIQDS